MTMLPGGAHVCDRCGTDVGNGATDGCIVVSTIDRDTGTPKIFHFCDEPDNDECCAKYVLSESNLADYLERQ